MSSGDMLSRRQKEAGWTDHEVIDILLDYIENQESPEAFADFLEEQEPVAETET